MHRLKFVRYKNSLFIHAYGRPKTSFLLFARQTLILKIGFLWLGGDMIKLFIITLLFISYSYAQDVQVVIDGHRYYCSQDPNNSDGTSELSCIRAADRFAKDFNACKSAGSTASYCFSRARGKMSTAEKKCTEVKDACNAACKESSNAQYCYSTCY